MKLLMKSILFCLWKLMGGHLILWMEKLEGTEGKSCLSWYFLFLCVQKQNESVVEEWRNEWWRREYKGVGLNG